MQNLKTLKGHNLKILKGLSQARREQRRQAKCTYVFTAGNEHPKLVYEDQRQY